MSKQVIITTLSERAVMISNAWYASHMRHFEQMGESQKCFRARFGVDRQFCYEIIKIICKYLDGYNVAEEVYQWVTRVHSVSQFQLLPEDLADIRMNLLIEVIDNELNYLWAIGRISEDDMQIARKKVLELLEYAKNKYLRHVLGIAEGKDIT